MIREKKYIYSTVSLGLTFGSWFLMSLLVDYGFVEGFKLPIRGLPLPIEHTPIMGSTDGVNKLGQEKLLWYSVPVNLIFWFGAALGIDKLYSKVKNND